MSNFKEIVTKAVVGKGRLTTTEEYSTTSSNNPSTILGGWVINHKFEGEKDGDSVKVNGSFDVNIWYSKNDNTETEVIKETVKYSDIIPITLLDDYDGQNEIIVRVIKQPNCTKAQVSQDGTIIYTIEKTIAAELVGDTKIRIGLDSFEDVDNIEQEINNETKENFLD